MRRLLWLAFIVFAAGYAHSQCAGTTSCSVANCNQTTVSSALSSMTLNGTTISVPGGSCSWSSNINFSTALSFSLIGASTVATTNAQGNPATFNDTTLITDTQAGTGGNNPILSITLTGSSSQVVRVSGFSWQGGNVVFNAELAFSGGAGTQFRFDHNHLITINDLAVGFYQPMSGVNDHNLFDAPTGSVYNGIRIYNEGGTAFGDGAWATATNFGTSSYVFLENNTFNNGFMNDCDVGGTFVARYNTFNVTAANQNIGIQTHATGSQQRARGCRAWEVYGNVIGNGGGSIVSSAGFLTAGTGVWWGNTVGNTQHDIVFDEDRDNANTYPQTATPNGWGYCGTNFNTVGSAWDQNTSTATGYACLDQIGRGVGDLLSGTFPPMGGTGVVNNALGGIAWPRQALEPVYIFMETYSGAGAIVSISSSNNNIQAGRDYYIPASPFTGAAGTGFGAFASIPGSCTNGTAYWATDQNKLYTCQSGSFAVYYTPYIYPHPLVTPTVLDGALLSTGNSAKGSVFQ